MGTKAGTLPAAPAPPPVVPDPEALAALPDAELAELETELVAWFEEVAPTAHTVEVVEQLQAVTEGWERVHAQRVVIEAEAIALQDQVTQLATRMRAQDDPDGEPSAPDTGAEEGDGEGEPAPGETEPTTAEPASPPPPATPETPPVTPASPTPPANPETGEAPAPTARAAAATVPARPAAPRMTLEEIRSRAPAHMQPRNEPPEGSVTITAAADVPGFGIGQPIRTVEDVAAALLARHAQLGAGRGGPDDRVPVVRFTINRPPERTLSSRDAIDVTEAKIKRFPREGTALTAAGGLCAPTVGYYDQMVLAEAIEPVADFLPTFTADRGGIRFNPPPKMPQITSGVGIVTAAQDAGGAGGPGVVQFTDAATTNGSATITSATAAFTFSDVGRPITGAGIPASTTIASVTNATTAVLSQTATATATGVTINITRGFKSTFHVTCPGIIEVVVQSIFSSIEFGNFLGRSFPEQVTAWTKLMAALHARVSETALLDSLAANSLAVTSAGLVGAGREILVRLGQAAMGYRNRNRMLPTATLDCLLPSIALDLVRADLTRSSAVNPDTLAVTDGQIQAWLAARNLRVGWYLDSKTGGNQIIAAQTGAGAVLNQFPTTIFAYVYSPGSFLRLDAGTLDLGLVRDSTLNANNNFRVFTEIFENVAFVGVESLEVAMTLCADGSAAAGKAVTCPIVT